MIFLPILERERELFGPRSLAERLQRGGLPDAFMSKEVDPSYYDEWLDAFFARDIQELYRIAKRSGFLSLMRVLLRQSGESIETTSLARQAGISRPTVAVYLDALQVTHVAFVLKPFHGGGRQEVLHRAKVYAFDTGFVCHARGWDHLRPEDCGLLWRHLVLDTIRAHVDPSRIHFWEDSSGREVDFVLERPAGCQDALVRIWHTSDFDPAGLRAFRSLHPQGANYAIMPQAVAPVVRTLGEHEVTFCSLADWEARMEKGPVSPGTRSGSALRSPAAS